MSGNKHYANNTGEEMISEYVDKLAQAFEELGVDYSNMSAAEAEQAYHKAVDAYNQKAQSMSEDEAEAAAMAEYYSGAENIDSTQTQADRVYYDGVLVDRDTDEAIRYAAREFAYAKDVKEAKENIKEALYKAEVDIAEEEKHIKYLGETYGVCYI